MQTQVLGFVPRFDTVKEGSRISCLNELSKVVNKLYIDEYAVSDKVFRRRERVRLGIESVVSASGAFPVGTKVAVFGSSANGFGVLDFHDLK